MTHFLGSVWRGLIFGTIGVASWIALDALTDDMNTFNEYLNAFCGMACGYGVAFVYYTAEADA